MHQTTGCQWTASGQECWSHCTVFRTCQPSCAVTSGLQPSWPMSSDCVVHLLGVFMSWRTPEACIQDCEQIPCKLSGTPGRIKPFWFCLQPAFAAKHLAPSLDVCRREQPEAVRADLSEPLVAGIASHHAGCLPAWKAIVERCFQRGELWPQPHSGNSVSSMRGCG